MTSNHFAVERLGPVELADREVDPSRGGVAALEADVGADGRIRAQARPTRARSRREGSTVHTKRRPWRENVSNGTTTVGAATHERVRRRDVERGLDRLLAVHDLPVGVFDQHARAAP